MKSSQEITKKMLEFLEAQGRNINQLSLTSQQTITDAYRLKSYTIQLQALLQKINALESLRKTREAHLPNMNSQEKKQYAQLQNQISTETQLLKATSEAMQETTNNLNKTDAIQHRTSGQIIKLKKEINKTLQKLQRDQQNAR